MEQETTQLSVKGFIVKPEFAKKKRGEQFFFVNGRFIKHAYLNHAVENAFAELLPTDAYPSYFLSLEIDPANIDINIHPTKTEVNFQDARYVYAVIQAAVKQSIGKHSLTPTIDFDVDPAIDAMFVNPPKEVEQPQIKINPDYNPFQESQEKRQPSYRAPVQKGDENWETLYQQSVPEQQPQQHLIPEQDSEVNKIDDTRFFQVHNRFILTNVRSGLMIIDQQKAHERILYEKFLQELENKLPVSQQQLFPITLQFSVDDAVVIHALKESLNKLGFTFDTIGNNGFVFQGIPEGMKESELEGVLEKIIETDKKKSGSLVADVNKSLARSLAVRLSTKAGAKLDVREMRMIFDSLFACAMPEVAPDGSNIVTIVPLKDLEKFLKEKGK